MGSGDSSRSSRPTLSIGDRLFVACFVLFGVTSFVFEPFVVVGCGGDGGLAACRDHGGTVGYLWWWYAASFDPVFLNTPPWLRVMCALDWLLFGACYVALIIGFMQRALWVRTLGMTYSAAITYSTFVYFGYEFLYEAGRADLLWVFIINVPYTIMPMLLWYRLSGSGPLWTPQHSTKAHAQ